jgi:hypothetical protein
VAFALDTFKPLHKGILLAWLKCRNRLQRLLEHAHQGVEIALVIHAAVAKQVHAGFAIEHRQFCQSFRPSYGFLIIGDCLLGLGDRDILIAHHIRTNPAVDGSLVRFEHVLAQGETGMEKSLIVLAGGVEVLNQAQQRRTVEVGKLTFEIGSGRFFLARFFHETRYLLLMA